METKKQITKGCVRYERLRRYAELADAKALKSSEGCAKFLVAALEIGNLATVLNAIAHVYRVKGRNVYADWMEATAKLAEEVSAPRTARRKAEKRERART